MHKDIEEVKSLAAYAGVGAFGAVLLGDEGQGEEEGGFGASKAGPGGSLVSAKEERDLAALLDLFALGVGDVEEFQDRLQAELAALEVPFSFSLMRLVQIWV